MEKSFLNYERNLRLTSEWILKSIKHGNGGSCAYYSPFTGWSKPYPETTGYLVPTLLRISKFLNEPNYSYIAKDLGKWLLSIQSKQGYWYGGLHSSNEKIDKSASVFNTGQVLKGMMALYYFTNDSNFLDAANKGADWLISELDNDGFWPSGDYRADQTPSYYSHVAWPILEVWKATQNIDQKIGAEKVLDNILARKLENGVISKWGFENDGPAFTHTIAYTIRGFQESSKLLSNYSKYAKPMEESLEFFVKKTELTNGRLPGEFNESLKANDKFVCLTGNAQMAISILIMEKENPDLRLVNSAAKLIDFIGSVQKSGFLIRSVRGAVAGSYPLWGRYMNLRYPNWAAKYYCDALMILQNRLESEI